MHSIDQTPTGATKTLLRWAQVATLAGLSLFVCAIGYFAFASFSDASFFDAQLVELFEDPDITGPFNNLERWTAVVLMLVENSTGILALWASFRLFTEYRRGNVFTLLAATRLRFIGWMVVLLTPLDMIVETFGTALFTHWAHPGKVNISISFEDVHVFALVFGLVIVVVGHVMYQAIAISDENRAFV
ncbi:MAG: DUF2975 domain-containing protein [Hyphomicrobiales bacterium]